jgi:hypothetical protein
VHSEFFRVKIPPAIRRPVKIVVDGSLFPAAYPIFPAPTATFRPALQQMPPEANGPGPIPISNRQPQTPTPQSPTANIQSSTSNTRLPISNRQLQSPTSIADCKAATSPSHHLQLPTISHSSQSPTASSNLQAQLPTAKPQPLPATTCNCQPQATVPNLASTPQPIALNLQKYPYLKSLDAINAESVPRPKLSSNPLFFVTCSRFLV